MFYITIIIFSFPVNKLGKFYHVLLAKCNHSRGSSKTLLKFFVKLSLKFQKIKYDGVCSSFLSKIVVLQL